MCLNPPPTAPRDLPESIRLEVLRELLEDLLASVPLFRYCSVPLQNSLLLALKLQVVAPGVSLVREGEWGEGVHFLSRGRLEILSEGGERSHGFLDSGESFGVLSLMLKERRTAAAKATTYCEVFVLERTDFERFQSQEEFREVFARIGRENTGRMSELVLEGVVL